MLVLNFLKDFKVLRRFIQKSIQPPACLSHGLYGHKPRYLPPDRAPKMPESQQGLYTNRDSNKQEVRHAKAPLKIFLQDI
jgi:hypothetical protein